MTDASSRSCLVVVAGAPHVAGLSPLASAVRPFLALPALDSARSFAIATTTAALAPDHHGPAHHLGRLIADAGRAARVVAPSRFPRVRTSNARWSTLSIPGGVTRLDSVPAPCALVDADALVLVNRLPSADGHSSPVIGVWSRFVPLTLRLGAMASGPREGLAAEIALAFRPALVVLAGEVCGIAVAVATVDQVAAELFGLAFAAVVRAAPDPATAIGPWEYPLVQRATELGLGVALPAEMTVRARWAGPAGKEQAVFADLLARVMTAVGIAEAAWDG